MTGNILIVLNASGQPTSLPNCSHAISTCDGQTDRQTPADMRTRCSLQVHRASKPRPVIIIIIIIIPQVV